MKTFINSRTGIALSSVKGFTLLELIVSITILSLVTLLIGSGFRLAIDSWEKGERETEWTQRLRILSSMMSQQLKSVYPYKIEVDNQRLVLFRGEEDSVTFVTALTGSSFGGFKWVRYSYKDGSLVYKEGLLPDKKVEEKFEGDEEVLDSDVREIKFEYLSEEDDWKNTWDIGEDLPRAVRIMISYFQPFYINIPVGQGENDENEILYR